MYAEASSKQMSYIIIIPNFCEFISAHWRGLHYACMQSKQALSTLSSPSWQELQSEHGQIKAVLTRLSSHFISCIPNWHHKHQLSLIHDSMITSLQHVE